VAAEDGRLSVEAAQFYARVYGAARAGCMNELRRAGCEEEEAEDVFAATFERIMRKFDPVDQAFLPAQMVALLKNACRQKLIDERRHQGVVRMVPLGDASAESDGASESPAEAVEEREAVAMGREAISSLPERDRIIFFQRHQLDLTPEEILRQNPGLSRRSYRKILQRANARALKAFEEIDSGARCAEMRREHLRRYVAAQASEKERQAVEAHLRHCRACRLGAARMRSYLHDVAAPLAALLAGEHARGGFLADRTARLLDSIGQGAQALGEATRAARERLRELALRGATAFPGSGGESAAGQVVGVSGMKAISVCAAGAIAASCLVAGALPGVSGLELLEQRGHRDFRKPPSASSVASQVLSPPAEASPAPSLSPPQRSSRKASAAGGVREKDVPRRARVTHSRPEAPSESSATPTVSGRQTGVEFGGEAEGAGAPVPSVTPDSSSGESASSGGGGVGLSRSTGGSTKSASTPASEFGF
jgi:RNA polymerase sigma factor (sigma-70 family)